MLIFGFEVEDEPFTPTTRSLSACTASSPDASVSVPPETVTSFACSASSALSTVNVPPETVSVFPALRPLQEAESSVRAVVWPPFAVTANVPPEIVRSPSA